MACDALAYFTLGTFARRLAQEFPTWQVFEFVLLIYPFLDKICFCKISLAKSRILLVAHVFVGTQFLLVDLRCHGDSAVRKKGGPHTVASTALDVLKLVCIS